MRAVFLAWVAFGLGCATVVPASSGRDEDAVRARVQAFGRAYRDADVDAVDRLLAARYVHSNGGHSPSDRAGYLKWNRTRAERIRSGAWRVDTYELSEVAVTVFGDTAVATGRVKASGQRDDKQWSSDVRFSNVWIREAGDWRRAAFHDADTE